MSTKQGAPGTVESHHESHTQRGTPVTPPLDTGTDPRPATPMNRIAAWFRKYRGPHTCLECGRPLTIGHNDAGRWWVACGKVELTLGDDYLSRNFPGHTVRVTESRPEFDCDHEHVERSGYSSTVGWWE